MVLSRRLALGLGVLWTALLVPAVPLWGHTCHGLVGFFAHLPLYAFQGLSAGLLVLGALVLAGRVRPAPRP